MSDLAKAIKLIEQQITDEEAKFAIADEGYPGESSLLATRDGYLNLARVLLRFVAQADAGQPNEPGENYIWDDAIKTVMYQVPTLSSAWLVGMYLCRDHAGLVAMLQQFFDPQINYSLTNDPQFSSSSEPIRGRQSNGER